MRRQTWMALALGTGLFALGAYGNVWMLRSTTWPTMLPTYVMLLGVAVLALSGWAHWFGLHSDDRVLRATAEKIGVCVWILVAGVVVVFQLGTGVEVQRRVEQPPPDTETPVPKSSLPGPSPVASTAPEVGCPDPSDFTTYEQELEPILGYDVAASVTDAHGVGEVVVASVGPALFNTPSGAPPTPDTFPEEAMDGLMVLSVTVLDVTRHFKGATSVDGYVVPQWGGVAAPCPEFAFDRTPVMMDVGVGDTGMAFVEELPDTWMAVAWVDHLRAKANALNADGGNYRAMAPLNWFGYDAPNAVSTWTDESTTIADLRQAVEEAVGQ